MGEGGVVSSRRREGKGELGGDEGDWGRRLELLSLILVLEKEVDGKFQKGWGNRKSKEK